MNERNGREEKTGSTIDDGVPARGMGCLLWAIHPSSRKM